MQTIYIKVPVSKAPPTWGWYDTDKGNLFWNESESEWSCRDDRVSSEYPTYWLEEIELPSATDIAEESYKDQIKRKTDISDIHSFREGAKWIIDMIFKRK